MARKSIVAAGMIVQTTSRVWLPWMYFAGCEEAAASYFHMNQKRSTSVATNTTPVRARMNMNRPSIDLPWTDTSLGSQWS